MDKILIWLYDIDKAINEIYSFLPETRNFLEFESDLKTKKAVERNIEIIGEATNRILKADENFQLTNAKKIISTRNRIIHDYENVSIDILWVIVTRDLPLLQIEVKELLSSRSQ